MDTEDPPRHLLQPYAGTIDTPVWFRAARVPADAGYPAHRHDGGELVYAFSGVLEIEIAGALYLAPPQYALWLPPGVEHRALNRREAHHASVYVAAALCATMPGEAAAITVDPLLRALLAHLDRHPPAEPPTEAEARLLQVLVDRLVAAPRSGSYLPVSRDPLLAPVLQALQADPADERSVAELAAAVGTTERTLARRCQRELGMPLAAWRQRLRVLRALALLDDGRKVEAIALDLGYASASAFIAMFRRLMGTTPDDYRSRRAEPGACR
ncbi:AraC family transcriptional regulator [Rubrivivax benzoatilyticus]|uniref:AraC family transcriptional regulator n=1 Tax=Rubrivivax benzoatilyticus TaxID=316997 RepID=A0ABX0HWK9_9BURK|nr:helix-turn-helix transcriptional regulator [Rubrivivax benzoatilyticus]EGJ12503.1 AraC family transcriptional regulator [Rubrivivax benzoatilyticus JA2 = ATCC BAA-35]MCD0421449.1 helix-turn-helix transcriptional regulator [Rubrivivax sp. JA1024]NHK98202.1 AraC family transcriptional regulator [Rubrivivax benzoatilyticus]NHL24023.1 AraC family transcriptional regulator [Rubrivivax benzoatilyticus]